MSTRANLMLILLGAVLVITYMSVFFVDERELAVKFRFGEIRKTDYEPGLHFKFPIVNDVRKFPKRILTRINAAEEFLTNEKKNLLVDFFIKWRVSDVARYYTSTGGDEVAAAQRLVEIIKDGMRAEFANRTVVEVVSAERSELMDNMLERAGVTADELGIALVDVRVKRIDLPDAVSDSVFNRMRQERARVAAQLRAEGSEEAERIRAGADRERTIILAEAYRDAQKVRGEGDARSAETYANAYNQDREFYSFHRSMQAYRTAIDSDNNLLVIRPDGDFFRFFGQQHGE